VTNQQVDILIIGGGLTGASLMLALRGFGLRTLLVEAATFADKTQADFDARSLALSPASKKILNNLGVWSLLEEWATPIETIHVSDKNHFGVSRLQAKANQSLGYVVEMQHINKALQELLLTEELLAPARLSTLDIQKQRAVITTDTGEVTIDFQLLVAADGAESSVRTLCGLSATVKQYQQQALVANIGLNKTHNYRAYERFTSQGPLALLPMTDNRMSMVWAMQPDEAEKMLLLSDAEFLKQLQATFGYRLGKLVKTGRRYSFPLKQVLMSQQVHWPVVFVGNAAHTLHPVAGQGFNLGLRDVATLAQCIAKHGLNKSMLHEYIELRRHDQQMITRLTDGLIHVFSSRLPGMGVARSLGLIAFDTVPALKNILARYARGFGGVIPDLVCDIALTSKEM
jgi:2-octaprenyl-6-methoxyphenol hydroxylase